MKLTDSQLRVLRLLSEGVRYPDFPTTVARRLEEMGLAEKYADDKGCFYFRITALGRAAAGEGT